MLEEFATAYLIQSPGALWLGICGLMVAGGLSGMLLAPLYRRTATLGRVPYFAWTGLVLLLVSVVQLAATGGPAAIVEGRAAALVVLMMLAPVIGGMAIGRLAVARSRDAFGQGLAAPFAVIPLANLWLLVAPSRQRSERESFGPMQGPEGVVVGLILLVLAGGAAWLGIGRTEIAIANNGSLPKQVQMQYLLNAYGLEYVLVRSSTAATLPLKVDDITTLVRIEVDGATFRRTYDLAIAAPPLSEALRQTVQASICQFDYFIPPLKAGASFNEVLIDAGGREVASITVTARDCGLSPYAGPWRRLAMVPLGWLDGIRPDGIEDRAISFSLQNDWQIWLASLALAIVGGLGSALLTPAGSTARMARAPYFLGNCILILVAAASMALLIPSRGVVLGGRVWAMVALWALVQVACGFALWHLAAARSRSAHGHAKAAPLAFIPLANLWLIVAPEREEADVIRRPRLAVAIASGFGGLALLGLAHVATGEIGTRTMWSLAANEDFPPQMRIEYSLGRIGLEETLQAVTSEPPIPDGDELVPQLAHVARGMEILRTFLITPRVVEEMERGNPMLATFFPDMARHEVCEGKTFIPLLKAGATVVNSYGDGAHELVAITLTAGDCGLSRGFLGAW